MGVIMQSEGILLNLFFLFLGFSPIIICDCKVPISMSGEYNLDGGDDFEIDSEFDYFENSAPGETLEERYQELIAFTDAADNGVVQISTVKEFQSYLIDTPRNYSVFVLFRKKPKESTGPDNSFRKFEWLAKFYLQGYKSNSFHFHEDGPKRSFFAEVVPEELSSTFDRLEVNELPALIYFPMEGKLSNLVRFDNRHRDLALFTYVHKWIEKMANIKMEVNSQDYFNYYLDHGSRITIFLVVAHTVFTYWETVLKVVDSVGTVNYLSFFGMGIAVVLISGHVFNVIRQPAFIGYNEDGSYILFSGGRRFQFQIEACIMSVMYFGFALGLILLTEGRRQHLRKPGSGDILTAVGAGLSLVGFCSWRYVTSSKSRN